MKYSDKIILFEAFTQKWGNELLDKVLGAVNLLASYPTLAKNIESISRFEKEEFREHQLEWIALIAQFDYPLDKAFFKDHWLSIQKFNRRNPLWQANYYDHIIRDGQAHQRIAEYIRKNPMKWEERER